MHSWIATLNPLLQTGQCSEFKHNVHRSLSPFYKSTIEARACTLEVNVILISCNVSIIINGLKHSLWLPCLRLLDVWAIFKVNSAIGMVFPPPSSEHYMA